MAEPGAESFAPPNGKWLGAAGILAVAALTIGGLVDRGSVPDGLIAVALPLGVLMWASMIRPQVTAGDGTLVMRNMLETVRIPLAAIENVSVGQVLAVRTSKKRYTASGVGRTARQAVQEKRSQLNTGPERSRLVAGFGFGFGSAFGHEAPARGYGMPYADWVEVRLNELIKEDCARRGVGARSGQAEVLAGEVRREPAWIEIAALAVTTAIMVVVLVMIFS